MASIRTRVRWDGSTAYSVRWRELGTRRQRSLTVHTEHHAHVLAEYLNAHGKPPEPKPPEAGSGSPTVADVVQEHIDLLIRPSSGTVATYQRMLDLHIRDTLGSLSVRDFGYRDIMQWIKALTAEGIAPKSIHNMHGLLSAAMNTAERLGYITDNPCRGVPLPTLERAEEDTRFLTPAEFRLLLDHMDEYYKTFVQFLVMTGTRFGEATAISVADIDLESSRVPIARINKAWKRDGQSGYYLGPAKTRAGKRTIGINKTLANLLRPLLSCRAGNELLFTTALGTRIAHKPFWQHQWVPAIQGAQANGLTKTPRIHDLRHTHASWLIQDGSMPLFTISRRLGHASVQTTEQVYGHLMPQALQEAAEATERAISEIYKAGWSAKKLKGTDGSIRFMDTDDSMAELYADADRLKGLTLRDLGFVPHPESLSSHERADLDAETLQWMAGISAEDRRLGLDRARLLAGALWQASIILLDELFADIIALYGKGQITREDIDETSVLWSLPHQYATRYTGRFARRFLLVAADLTTKLAGTWTMPSCVAQELAVRCLLDKVDLIAATHDLELEPDWRGTLTDRMLKDTDSEMLYDPSLDGFQHNEQLTETLRLAPMTFEHWFEPFGEDGSVAPYARTV